MSETIDKLLAFDRHEVDGWICANLFGPAVELETLDHDQQLALLLDWALKARPDCRSYLAYFPVNFFPELQFAELASFYDDLSERATCAEELENIRAATDHVVEMSQ